MRQKAIQVGILSIIALQMALSPLALAQGASINDQRLVQLYSSLQRNPASTYVQQQITTERERLRVLIDDELNNSINALLSSEKNPTQTPYEQERAVVTMLQSRDEAAKVDMDLLKGDSTYYLNASRPAASGSTRITASYPEFLAQQAILEERLASTEFFLKLHQERFQKLTQQQQIEQFSLLITIGQYMLVIVVIIFLERLGRTTLFRAIKNRNRRYAVMKIYTGLIYVLVGLWLIIKLSSEHPDIITSFAIVGAGIAVALQDVLKDIVGWAIILQRRLFSLGHRVSIGDVTGDVIDIGLLRTTLMEVASRAEDDIHRTGKTVLVPNSCVLRESVRNYNTTSDFLETQMQFYVMIESDWQRGQTIVEQVLKEETDAYFQKAQRQQAARTHHFYFSRESHGPRVFLEIGDRGVLFTLRFLVPIGERRSVTSRITTSILERFAAEKPRIHIAFAFFRESHDEKGIIT